MNSKIKQYVIKTGISTAVEFFSAAFWAIIGIGMIKHSYILQGIVCLLVSYYRSVLCYIYIEQIFVAYGLKKKIKDAENK